MRKMVLLFAILGLITGACQYAYAARTVIECGGEEGIAWAEGMYSRFEEFDADLQAADALLQSSTYLELDTPDDLIWLRDELEPYAQRAKDRYMQQMAQLAPPCLRVTKDLMADVFYFDWKTYEALQHGDAQRVAELQQQTLAATEAVLSEYDRLVEKYHWEK